MKIGEDILSPPQYRMTPSFIWHKNVSFIDSFYEMTELRFVCLHDPPRRFEERDLYGVWTFHVDLAWESKKSRDINNENCRADVIEKCTTENDITAYNTTGSPEIIGNISAFKDWREFWVLIIKHRIDIAAWLQKPRNARSKQFLENFLANIASDFPQEPINAVKNIFNDS